MDSTYTPANPRVKTVSVFAINQSFFNHQLELEYGFIPGVRLFYGMALGGSASTAALGPSSVVPFQVGMSATEPTPTVNVIVRDPSLRFYNSTARLTPDRAKRRPMPVNRFVGAGGIAPPTGGASAEGGLCVSRSARHPCATPAPDCRRSCR